MFAASPSAPRPAYLGPWEQVGYQGRLGHIDPASATMHVLNDLASSRRFPPRCLRILRERAIHAAVGDPGARVAWLGIEQAEDDLESLQSVLIRVLHLGGDPIGFGVARPGRIPRLTGLYVDPAWQRRGHGREILTALVGDLATAGAIRLVTAAASPAKAFYLAFGFQEGFPFSASPPGLDQGPRMYFHHMTLVLRASGFHSSSRNHCHG